MTKIRQLPEVYLRGSLANETMKNLTEKQRQRVDILTTHLSDHQCLAGHRTEFTFQLGRTIACDYNDSKELALEEFRIAIWRGVVHLLYHRDYEYECNNCGAGGYISQAGKHIKFNRRYEICPACNHCAIDHVGGTKLKQGSFVEFNEFQMTAERLRRGGAKPPTLKSCIRAIPGKPKIANPDKMLNDPNQIVKFFGTWVWNYFRQILLENKITRHERARVPVRGEADGIIAQCIANMFANARADYAYAFQDDHSDGHLVTCNPLYTSPLLSVALGEFVNSINPGDYKKVPHEIGIIKTASWRLRTIGVKLDVSRCGIRVKNISGLPPFITSEITIANEVQVVSNTIGGKKKDDDDVLDTIKQLEQPNMYPDEGVPAIEQIERLQAVRHSLPDSARPVFNLLMCGTIPDDDDIYQQFIDENPDQLQSNHGIPRQNRMAQFLGCSTKDIKRCCEQIRTQCYAFGIVPE